jgi:hypothetical protein
MPKSRGTPVPEDIGLTHSQDLSFRLPALQGWMANPIAPDHALEVLGPREPLRVDPGGLAPAGADQEDLVDGISRASAAT